MIVLIIVKMLNRFAADTLTEFQSYILFCYSSISAPQSMPSNHRST